MRLLAGAPNAPALVLMEPVDDPAVPQDVEVALPSPTDDVPPAFTARVLPAGCTCTVDGAADVLAAHQLLDCWLSQEGLLDIGPRRVSVVGDAVTSVSAVVVS